MTVGEMFDRRHRSPIGSSTPARSRRGPPQFTRTRAPEAALLTVNSIRVTLSAPANSTGQVVGIPAEMT